MFKYIDFDSELYSYSVPNLILGNSILKNMINKYMYSILSSSSKITEFRNLPRT